MRRIARSFVSGERSFATLAVVTEGQSDVGLEADSTTKSTLVGGGAGAVSGATAGVLIGGLQGLPSKKAEQVTEILAGLPRTRDFQEELRSAVEAAVPEDRRATSDRAEATAILQLTALEQHLRAKMTLEWGPKRGDRDSRSYEYETPDRHVDEWLSEDGAAFGTSLTEGIDTIAGQMSRDLLSPAPQ